MSFSRRDFLKTLTAGAALHCAPLALAAKPPVQTKARIVILGAGVGFCCLAIDDRGIVENTHSVRLFEKCKPATC